VPLKWLAAGPICSLRPPPEDYNVAISSSKLATSRVRYQVSRLQTRPQLAAVLDCLFELDPKRTSPILVELALVDERLLFARAEGDATFKHFVGRTDELTSELLGFARRSRARVHQREDRGDSASRVS
jgi:hypothetical protein